MSTEVYCTAQLYVQLITYADVSLPSLFFLAIDGQMMIELCFGSEVRSQSVSQLVSLPVEHH